MSYIDNLTEALIKVITHACGEPEATFAGYAVNRPFWVAEALHVLQIIDGYPERFERMSKAIAHEQPNPVDWPTQPIKISSSKASDLSRNHRRVRDCMRRFLSGCLKISPDEIDDIMNDCRTLGIPTPI
jgi:hypothetical protein